MSTLQIFPHDSVGFALQSMEDSIAGGEFYPGEPGSLLLSVPHAMESWVTRTWSLPVCSLSPLESPVEKGGVSRREGEKPPGGLTGGLHRS